MSACQRSFGIAASNRQNEDLGRFCGCGVTKPRRDSTRQIVETAGGATVAPFEVEGDRVSAGIVAFFHQVFAELDDLVLEGLWDPVGAPARTPGPWLETGITFGLEPPAELVDPPPRDPVVSADLGLGTPLDQDRRDHQQRQRHRPPP